MSDKGTIFLKYDIETKRLQSDEKPEKYKGLMVNCYRGLDPAGMIARVPYALKFFMINYKKVSSFYYPVWTDTLYQEFRRMFDVFFDGGSMHVSTDGVELMKHFLDNGWTTPEKISDDIFFYDEDYGQLYIFVKGNDADGCKAYYLYYYHDKYMSSEEYLLQSFLSEDEKDALKKYSVEINQLAELMTKEERDRYFAEDYYELLYKDSEESMQKGPILNASMPRDVLLKCSIDELCLSIRSYGALRRAGITTIGELMNYTTEDLQSIRNMSHKSLAEVIESVEELGLKFASDSKDE